jgi:hypothetical protein
MGGGGSKSKPEFEVKPVNPYKVEKFTVQDEDIFNNKFLNKNKHIVLVIIFILLYAANFILLYYKKLGDKIVRLHT